METNQPASGSNFFSRPEGKLGLAILGGFIAVVFLFGGTLGAYMVSAFYNMLELTIIGIVEICILTAVLLCLFDPKLRNLIFYLYRSFCRWLAKFLLITRDPIGVRITYVEEAKKKKATLDRNIVDLRSQRQNTRHKFEKNQEELDHQHRLAEVVRKASDTRTATLSNLQSGTGANLSGRSLFPRSHQMRGERLSPCHCRR